MKFWVLSLVFSALLAVQAKPLWAAAAEILSTVSSPDASSPKESNAKEEDNDESEKPFVPYWSGQVDASYSNQPSQLGQGQIQRQLGLTGIYNFTESGTYASLGVVAGRQIVEGTDSTYGQFNLEGGLGLAFFQPSLAFQFQRGESALNSVTSTLTLNFQLWDPFTIGATFSGGLQSQQGPVSQVLGTSDATVEIDSRSWSSALTAEFVPWDFLTLSLAATNAYDNTYLIQNTLHTVTYPLNQIDNIPSITLGTDITFLTDFILAFSVQVGHENLPAGTIYSPILGKTVTFDTPSTQGFSGLATGLTYNFK
jgi:hypothetical protein